MNKIQEQNASLILIVDHDDTIKILKNRNWMKKSDLIKLLNDIPDTNPSPEDSPSA